MDLRREWLGVSGMRWLLAASGLGFAAVAFAGAASGSSVEGVCLGGAVPLDLALGHCGWCYAAVAALLTAAAPAPRFMESRLPRR